MVPAASGGMHRQRYKILFVGLRRDFQQHRSSRVVLALYTLGTALIAHHYWTMTGANKIDSMEIFYKNLSIVGGFLLLFSRTVPRASDPSDRRDSRRRGQS